MNTMQQTSVTHSTFVIERSYRATPERVFAAFSDPATKRSWFAEANGRQAEVFESHLQVGGRERTVSLLGETTPFPGVALTNDTVFLDIVPNRRVVLAYTMSPGENKYPGSLATFEFLATDTGTDLVYTERGGLRRVGRTGTARGWVAQAAGQPRTYARRPGPVMAAEKAKVDRVFQASVTRHVARSWRS